MSPRTNREAYASIYISAPWHKKVRGLPAADRLAAFGFFTATLALCQSYRNDGHVPAGQLAAVIECSEAERKRLTQALIAAGMFEEEPDGIFVHDYLDHNNSRDEIESARARMSEGGHRGGKIAGKNRPIGVPLKPTLQGFTEKRRAEQSRGEERSAEPCSDETSASTPDPGCETCGGTGLDNGKPCWCM